MSKAKDLNDTCNLLGTIATIGVTALEDGVSVDVIIDSIATSLGAFICQKHQIEVHSPMNVSNLIIEAATKITLADKRDPLTN